MNKLWGLVTPEQAAACSATSLSRVDLVLVEKFSYLRFWQEHLSSVVSVLSFERYPVLTMQPSY